jgi:hypothetical protein
MGDEMNPIYIPGLTVIKRRPDRFYGQLTYSFIPGRIRFIPDMITGGDKRLRNFIHGTTAAPKAVKQNNT